MNEQKFGKYVFISLVICALVGSGFGLASGNIFKGLWTGTLICVFLGWFIAAAVQRKEKISQEKK